MIIGVDIDNTLVSTTPAVLEFINERLGTVFHMGDVKDYYIENLLVPELRWIVADAFRSSEMWKRVKPIDGALETVEDFIEQGHEVYFCTSTYPENVRKKTKHLVRNSNLTMDFVSKRMINIQNKGLLRLDVLIDDCLTNLLVPDRTYYSICLNYPWNQNVPEDTTNFFRVNYWQEIRELILS